MPFQQFHLAKQIIDAIKKQGYDKPTPIQQQAIPLVMSGKDVIAAAQTGTGKTAAFALPLLQRLITKPAPSKNIVRALILTPTRELAAQVHQSVSDLSCYLNLKPTVIFGGVKINPQISKLKKGADIVTATPGRLLDLVNQRAIDLSKVEILVLDEADRMLDMGFIHDIKKIINLLPKDRQSLLFSATVSPEIKSLAGKLLNNPTYIKAPSNQLTADRISQLIYPVDKDRKRELLSYTIGSKNWRQVLVFIKTKHAANRLAEQLEKDGLSAAAIHGNKSQGARTSALAAFKAGTIRVLVATDIAARGIDIDKLPYVINYNLPSTPEDYVHRIGRTGRAANEGLALSLYSIDEQKLLKQIEKLINMRIPQEIIAGFKPDLSIKAEPDEKPIVKKPARRKKFNGNAANQRSNSRPRDRASR
jgi:ATP-dependent RNA helicase RhlE